MIEAPLSQFTTIAIGGSARKLAVARSEQEIIGLVQSADRENQRVLVLGGGSNVLMPDSDPRTGVGFEGTVVLVSSEGIREESSGSSDSVLLEVQAGCSWDRLVEYTVFNKLSGLEALSGIPGTVGAAPVQNIGAYGAEVKQAVFSVRVWDRRRRRILTFVQKDLGFSYRSSLLKKTLYRQERSSPRYIVLAVCFRLFRDSLSLPVRYSELARYLNVELGERVPIAQLRKAVLGLRAIKGMTIDRNDRDTYSTGSFFTNPVVSGEKAATLPLEVPRYPQSFKRGPDGILITDAVKLSAAWLIDKAGFAKGYGLEGTSGYAVTSGRVSLSTKHTLAITNRGLAGAEATQKDVIALTGEIEKGVAEYFGLRLEPETVVVKA